MSPLTMAFEWHFALPVTVTHENHFNTIQVVITAFANLLLSVRHNVR
jgi:hypothetical protein